MTAAPSAHTLRVCGLYRRALKTTFNWVVDRETFIAEAIDLRKQFEANRHVRSAPLIEKICSDAEADLVKFKHPDPYKRACAALPRRVTRVYSALPLSGTRRCRPRRLTHAPRAALRATPRSPVAIWLEQIHALPRGWHGAAQGGVRHPRAPGRPVR